MSRYAYLACMDCQVCFFLGKAVYHRENDRIDYFHLGLAEYPPNWERPELNQVIWKMLADHAGHTLRVPVSGDPDFDRIASFAMIGGTAIGDISKEDYLKDWNGLLDREPAVEDERRMLRGFDDVSP